MAKFCGWGYGDVIVSGTAGHWTVEKSPVVVRRKGTGGNRVHYRVFNESNVPVQLRFHAGSWDPSSPFNPGNAPTGTIQPGEMKPLRRVLRNDAAVNTMYKFRFEIKRPGHNWVLVMGDPWVFVY